MNIPKDLALERSAWKTAIHVPELPLGFNSSLPQTCLGLKGFVVVVIVVVSEVSSKMPFTPKQSVFMRISIFKR